MGSLPHNWRMLPLGEVATLQRGFDLPVQARIAGEYPVFAANGIVGTHSTPKVKGPGVVTGRSGSIGKVHFVEGDFWPLNTSLWVKNFWGNDPEWVAYLLRWFDLGRFARGAAVPTLDRKLVHSELVPVPPLDEQIRIVAHIQECLARVGEIQQLQSGALDELGSVLPAYLYELEQAAGWPKITVKELVASTQNGRSIRSNGDTGNGRVLTLSAVRTPQLDFVAAKTVELDDRTARNYCIRQGDVFVSRSNTSELVGLSAVAQCNGPSNTIFPDLLIRLKPRLDKVVSSYLANALRFPSVRKQIRGFAKGTSQSMVKISGAELREVIVPVPSLAEQKKAVTQIEALGETCYGLSEAFDLHPGALVDAVLRKAFAGEL